MNLIAVGLSVAGAGAFGGAGAATLLPARQRAAAVGLLTATAGAGGALAGVAALSGDTWTAHPAHLFPLGTAVFAVDALSGAFLAIVGAVAIAVGVFSIGYAGATHGSHSGAGPARRFPDVVLPLFVAAMMAVPMAACVTTLLMAWELMALASLVLVLVEHERGESVRSAGVWYGVMTHLGFLAILVGLALFAGSAGGESFAALRAGAGSLGGGTRTLIFLLVLIGFASKAGMVPLHVWLPRAHPEAPSHVSALMSAGMVNLGAYGLLRTWFDLLGGGPRWWGVLVLTIGATSALYGALQASVATDLKVLLAFSTTEHLGLILLGIGAAGMLAAGGNDGVAGLLVAAVILHAFNHAAFKTALFLGAGSVLRATGLRDLDRMGGLVSRMPSTAALFACASVCAAALPPGNGFVSEWLLLQGLVHGAGDGAAPVAIAVAMPLAVGVVALTAGLGAVASVKAFGVGFLARPRSAAATDAVESPTPLRWGIGLAVGACAALALAPGFLDGGLGRVVSALPAVGGSQRVRRDGIGLHLSGIAGSMSPLLVACALVGTAIALAITVAPRRNRARRSTPIWGCGGMHIEPQMEYTATSFAEPLTRVFDDVLGPQSDLVMTPYAESRYLIESAQYRRQVPDRLEARLYPPVISAVGWWGQRARLVANGSVHRYLAYGLVGLVTLIVVIGLVG
jgi:formate hydrogenlyase subunit 3/multisubunit Na+/H+ antiporter MnhD subunit